MNSVCGAFRGGAKALKRSQHPSAALQAYYHQVGTCKMGNDGFAVLDHALRVHGLEGLRIVDASILPVVLTGNTIAATYIIAEKGADPVEESA